MAAATNLICSLCSNDNQTKEARKWCTNCGGGLCEDCENVHRKASRSHQVISIEDYSKIEHVLISHVCEQHGKTLEWFCRTHDEVLCMVCVPAKHKACPNVISIGAASTNVRQSAAISQLEDFIEGTLRNVEQCIKNRESASEDIAKLELVVKSMVLETKSKIIVHLDKLQDNLLRQLRVHTCTPKYMKFQKRLESTKEVLNKLKEQTIHMQEFVSNIQIFLGTQRINKQIVSEIESFKSEFSDTNDYELNIDLHSLVEKLSKEVEDFGEIHVSEYAAKFNFGESNNFLTNTWIDFTKSRNISDTKLQLIKTFHMKKRKNEMHLNDCVILPNGHILFSNNTKDNILIECDDTWENVRDIPVSDRPYGIALIDPNRIVVTYGEAKFIEIMNTNTCNVETKITFSKNCLGVSYGDGRLYMLHGYGGKVLDLSGRQLETFKTESGSVAYIETSRDRIFYTDYQKNKVHCCYLNGDELWQHNSNSMKCCHNVAVDNYNNVYVAGYISDDLTISQHDGKNSKTLLTRSDGVIRPKAAVFYDQNKTMLLIYNEKGYLTLYKVA